MSIHLEPVKNPEEKYMDGDWRLPMVVFGKNDGFLQNA